MAHARALLIGHALDVEHVDLLVDREVPATDQVLCYLPLLRAPVRRMSVEYENVVGRG